MTTKAKYPKMMYISEEENATIEKLKSKGVKVIDIFRKGITIMKKEHLNGGQNGNK